jgi:hypothetical protein
MRVLIREPVTTTTSPSLCAAAGAAWANAATGAIAAMRTAALAQPVRPAIKTLRDETVINPPSSGSGQMARDCVCFAAFLGSSYCGARLFSQSLCAAEFVQLLAIVIQLQR